MITRITLLVATLIAAIGVCRAQIETVIDTDCSPAFTRGNGRGGRIVYDSRRDALLASAIDLGNTRSVDGGATFRSMMNGIPSTATSIFSTLLIENDRDYVFVGCGDDGWSVYRSVDGGETFQGTELPRKPGNPVLQLDHRHDIIWFVLDGVLGMKGGTEWRTLPAPSGLGIRVSRILSKRDLAVFDGQAWYRYDIERGTWGPLDLPAQQPWQGTRLDDGRLLWSVAGRLMVGTGMSGQKRYIDSVYVQGEERHRPWIASGIATFGDHIVLVDSNGIVGRWDQDSIVVINHDTFTRIPGGRRNVSLGHQSLGGTDILTMTYHAEGPQRMIDIVVADIVHGKTIRTVSMSYPYPYENPLEASVLMLNDSTIIVNGHQGALTRIPAGSGPRSTMWSVEDEPAVRPKTAMLDGHVLDDGSLLAHTEHGRWLHRRPSAEATTIPFDNGYVMFRGSNHGLEMESLCARIPTGFSFMKVDGDSAMLAGIQGIRVSLDDMTQTVLRDSLTTYAYREPGGGRTFMGTYDVRWTSDKGRTWLASRTGLPDNNGGPLPCISGILRTQRGTMVLGLRGFGRRLMEGMEADSVPGGIYYSTDDGSSWLRSTGLGERSYIQNIAELANGDLIAVVSHVTIRIATIGVRPVLQDALMRDNALMHSTDGGRTWDRLFEAADSRPFAGIRGSVIRLTSGDIVVQVSDTEILRSTDAGTTWSAERNAPATLASVLAIDADASDRLYFFTDHGVFRQSTPTSVEDIAPQNVSMDVRLVDGVLHATFGVTDMTGTAIAIVDLQGRTMRSFTASRDEFSVPVTDLPPGLYVITASGWWGRASKSIVAVH
ncbi:MAG: hypothetical protein J0I17_06595 ['Candidatus Kapabacteria' thiocyanatum]|uniref:Secretion system C-terminal sorting domain-containing protein n=1 Tax=Candidatus Kapaibacterium thiocyanatum TaxID=1895771 RepID=A0A1M3L6M9_9BACT|nr:hypothetical protein ['Candidatus Kapabacteria' thiocyanatum]OJX61232.1 MAG: hypothetical protein BGO89_01220 ['Candidatus Kapabacteria' thiocyanatum]